VSYHAKSVVGDRRDRSDPQPMLQIEDLHIRFHSSRGTVFAVNGISFSIAAGECVALVGESGSGKSATASSILRLLPTSATIEAKKMSFAGLDLATCNLRKLREIRGKRIAMVFQDPSAYLNPVLTVGRQLMEVLQVHEGLGRSAARERAAELLSMVGVPAAHRRLDEYPHQFSGGMRQRAMIATAIACSPSLLIADEPTTALDVTVQAQIMKLLKGLQERLGMAMLLVSHDLRLVTSAADRVLLMYGGKIVEEGGCNELLNTPMHPYTLALWRAAPRLDMPPDAELVPVGGIQRELREPPRACVFHERCEKFMSGVCDEEHPALKEASASGHAVACYYPATYGGNV
jgi:oligopeptide/dipeptide ABC transporter ATP-binding protein